MLQRAKRNSNVFCAILARQIGKRYYVCCRMNYLLPMMNETVASREVILPFLLIYTQEKLFV